MQVKNYPELQIDFAELIGPIRIFVDGFIFPALDISYPVVVQGGQRLLSEAFL